MKGFARYILFFALFISTLETYSTNAIKRNSIENVVDYFKQSLHCLTSKKKCDSKTLSHIQKTAIAVLGMLVLLGASFSIGTLWRKKGMNPFQKSLKKSIVEIGFDQQELTTMQIKELSAILRNMLFAKYKHGVLASLESNKKAILLAPWNIPIPLSLQNIATIGQALQGLKKNQYKDGFISDHDLAQALDISLRDLYQRFAALNWEVPQENS